MNVLLVFPFSIIEWNNKYEEPRIPLNITYLASAVRKAGHPVQLLDLRVEQQKRNFPVSTDFAAPEVVMLTSLLKEKIQKSKVELVGINCLYSGLFPVVVYLAKRIKAINPKIQVVIGGIHPTIYPTVILEQHSDCIDYVIIGEGETALVDLIRCLSAKDLDGIERIDGFAWLKDGKPVMNLKKQFIEPLDELPFPGVDLLNIPDYYTDTSGWHSPKGLPIRTPVPIITSRSCPNMCNFCSMHFVHGKKIRYRSPENVIEEMKMYIDRYGLTYFNITDDNLTINKKRLITLMNMIIKENMNIQFSTENGVYVNTLDEEVLDAMSQAGLARLHLAFETGSDYIRTKVIGKNLLNKRIDEIKQIISKDKYNHIFLYGYFVIGFPEETEKTLDETYQLITTFPLDNYSVFYATPFPGTRLYEQCLRDNLFTEKFFYDSKMLANQVDVGQMVKGMPFIQPYHLEIPKIIEFKEKAMEFLRRKRSDSPVSPSSPLRLKK